MEAYAEKNANGGSEVVFENSFSPTFGGYYTNKGKRLLSEDMERFTRAGLPITW